MPLVLPAILSILLTACSAPPPEVRDGESARHAAERYLADLAAHNPRAGREAVGPAPDAAFVGGTVLHGDRPVSIGARMLAAAIAAARDEADRAALEMAVAGEEDADSLWRRSEAMSRRARVLEHAWAAGMRSSRAGDGGRGAPAGATPDSTLRLCKIFVRTRWGGPRVGPERVDREYVMRMAAGGRGPWIAISLLPRDRDPLGPPF